MAAPARAEEITVAEARMTVARPRHVHRPTRAELERWLRRAMQAITLYYGHFPVAHVELELTVTRGRHIDGTAYMGRAVRLSVGRDVKAAALDSDWTLTHELFHLAFPSHDRRYAWMQEGMATYFEPIARARAGQIPEEDVWKWMLEGLPKGMPAAGEKGLNARPTWGATYWGGALFWLMVDVGIRDDSHDARSADDVLRGLLAAGGDGTQEWAIARILEEGDKATGTSVLSRMYARMADGDYVPDLADLERRLGVELRAGKVVFHDDAPLAAVRKAITHHAETPPSHTK